MLALGREVEGASWGDVLAYILEANACPCAVLASILAGEPSCAVGLAAHRTRGRARWALAA